MNKFRENDQENLLSEVVTFSVPFDLGDFKENININLVEVNKENLFTQELLFKSNGLDRSAGLKKLNEAYFNLGLPKYSEERIMNSEHLIIFASLAAKQFNPKKILEIGTYLGYSSCILATLFPESEVFTIDLKDDDSNFKNFYNRRDQAKMEEFLKVRNKYLNMRSNIKFLQESSLFLTRKTEFKDQFDLIWIDGAHGYPVVCADIINSISLANPNTIILCDDVYKNTIKNDAMYRSLASWETIEELRKTGIISSDYFFKRLGIQKAIKFVAYITLNKV